MRTTAGYRLYTAGDLERLHRIAAYREIGLCLDRIRAILDDSTADVPGALRAQRTQVARRIDHLQQLSADLDRMIAAHERGLLLTVEQQAAIFGPQWNPDWPAQARQRYGDTTQWQQYAERCAPSACRRWAPGPARRDHARPPLPGFAPARVAASSVVAVLVGVGIVGGKSLPSSDRAAARPVLSHHMHDKSVPAHA
ncbi:MerR family DNA-binding protein [Micromonospora deserti]|uniref:MerR family DNA-binding protein n=1 Tax=Micromonospora deserti TaxID=2070366 RepID=UPI0034DD8892